MKFAHMSDCHVGGWREEKLKELSIKAFQNAIETCVKENVAFVLIAGDLFNTSLPSIDILKHVAEALDKLREHDISCYIIPGSHDFSPSGKTMLDVLEKSGLVENVMKLENNELQFTIDKTNTKITGIYGLRQGLDRNLYKRINKEALARESGFKVFIFHAMLEEFKPKEFENVEAQSYVDLPRNFNYYAGGHVHLAYNEFKQDYGLISYPGPLFPNSFKELEELKYGGFYIVDDKLNITKKEVKLKEVANYLINAQGKTAQEVEDELRNIKDVKDKILLVRVEGTLTQGKVSDINFKLLEDLNAYIILKNTNKLRSLEFKEFEIKSGEIEDVELAIIKENLSNTIKDEDKLIVSLVQALNLEKEEGERNMDFDARLVNDVNKILQLD